MPGLGKETVKVGEVAQKTGVSCLYPPPPFPAPGVLKTGLLCVVLTGLELSWNSSLALNSEICGVSLESGDIFVNQELCFP